MLATTELIRRNPVRGGRTTAAPLSWFAVIAMACAAASLVLAPPDARAAEPEIVARVNGEPLTRAEFQRMRANPLTVRQLQQELGVQDPDAEALDRFALRKLIQHRLVLQEARLRKMFVKEKELDEAVAALRRRFGDLKSFGEWMKVQGLNDRSLIESVREDMLADRVRAALVKDVRVTDEQVQQYYETHKEQLKTVEVRLQIIVLKDKAAAEEALTALRGGKDFATLARERSVGRRAVKGGDTGWVAYETLWPPLRKFVSRMKVGHAGGPLQNGNEFLVVRLGDRRSGRTVTLAEAKPQIEPHVLALKQQEVVRDWLADKEKKAKIEVLIEPDVKRKMNHPQSAATQLE
jgi:parvulin-like peptidyl-prolyl isomerase